MWEEKLAEESDQQGLKEETPRLRTGLFCNGGENYALFCGLCFDIITLMLTN